MKILIVYGTSEGQTRKIARFMEEVLQNENHRVVVADSTDEPPLPTGFDAILIGSSIHIHKYQTFIKHYVMDNLEVLNHMYTAFFSVSMAIASDIQEEHDEAEGIASDFLEETGWHPNKVTHIAGALKYTKYDYFKKLVMRMIAKRQGGATDTSQDFEYTDWNAVKAFVLDFAHKATPQELKSL